MKNSMNHVRIWWADTRGKVIATLFVLWIVTMIHSFQPVFLINPLVAIVSMYAFDFCISRVRSGKGIVTLSSLVTGLLIGLVFDPTAAIWVLIIACLVAAFSKQFIAFGSHRHIWNPAVLGIAVTSIIFNQSSGWWAASWGIIPVLIIVAGMTLALSQIRRVFMPFIFLGIMFVYLSFTGTWSGAFELVTSGTFIFFAFIMLPEPVTSIGGKTWLYGWPVFVGGLVVMLSVLRIFIVDPVMLALLIANAAVYVIVRHPWVTLQAPST